MGKRREFLIAFGAAAIAASFRSVAQPAKVPLLAYLTPVVPENNTDWRLEAFLQGMRDLGYTPGTSSAWRYAGAKASSSGCRRSRPRSSD